MKNLIDLTGQRILVTGASSGIGRATAVLLSQAGASIILSARNEERLDQTLQMLTGGGHSVEPFDLTQVDDIPEWIMEVSSRLGCVNGLAHVAGIHGVRPVKLNSASFVDEILKTNLGSAFGLARGLRHKKVIGPDASFVFVSSVAGMVGEAGATAYGASKSGLISIAKSMGIELAREGIRVNCVSPSMVQTEMTEQFNQKFSAEQMQTIRNKHPLGFGTPDDVAAAIAFLLSRSAKWITGTNLVVDGGYSAQ